MRALTLTFALLMVSAPAHAAGAYATLAARDAAACARLCAEDGLCVAWSMNANAACELRATAPTTPLAGAFGYSSRAPAELRQSLVNELRAPVSAPTPIAPPAPVAPPEEAAVIADPLPLSAMITEDDMTLLGGPETESAALRPRLGLRN